MNQTDQIFYLAVISSGVGLITLIIKSLSKSKCDTIKCGCINIHRNVEIEKDLDELEMNKSNLETSSK
jgi:hypothetical protein